MEHSIGSLKLGWFEGLFAAWGNHLDKTGALCAQAGRLIWSLHEVLNNLKPTTYNVPVTSDPFFSWHFSFSQLHRFLAGTGTCFQGGKSSTWCRAEILAKSSRKLRYETFSHQEAFRFVALLFRFACLFRWRFFDYWGEDIKCSG